MATFGTFTAGQVLTAAELNTAGAYLDYTPTWTQSATITKTVNWARYTQLGKLVIGSVKMTATSAGTANNKIIVSFPVAASSNNFLVGTAAYIDTGASRPFFHSPPLSAFFESSTTMSFSPANTATTSWVTLTTDARLGQDYQTYTGITVASTDIIYIHFQYEAA